MNEERQGHTLLVASLVGVTDNGKAARKADVMVVNLVDWKVDG